MYGLSGKMVAQPGQRDKLIDLLLTSAKSLQEMDGCYLYTINEVVGEPDAIWINEVWRGQEDHQASLANEGVLAVIAEARPLIAEMLFHVELTPRGGKGLP